MRESREVALFVGLVLLIALFPPDVGYDIGGQVPGVGDGTEGPLEMASLETAFDWLDEFGGDLQDSANDVEMDGLDVYVGGSTKGPLVPGMPAGFRDGFVRKYSHEGDVVWTTQFGTLASDTVNDIFVLWPKVFITGTTGASLMGRPYFGGSDVFVMILDASTGSIEWVYQFGTTVMDYGECIYYLPSGIYVGGNTGGTFPGQVNVGNMDAFLARIGPTHGLVQLTQYGTTGYDFAWDIAYSPFYQNTGIFVCGDMGGSYRNKPYYGDQDGYIMRFDVTTTIVGHSYLGTPQGDHLLSIEADNFGKVYVAGDTRGSMHGTNAGGSDIFALKLDPTV
ncbi:MAG: hypothetical protein KAJ35_10185, partial [Thermoplasmata archaeon]|nr:hypothetical protein [Thermoplasmata archaeon]